MHTIARIVLAAAHPATCRRPLDGSAGSAALPPSDLEPRNAGDRSAAITVPRRGRLGATLEAITANRGTPIVSGAAMLFSMTRARRSARASCGRGVIALGAAGSPRFVGIDSNRARRALPGDPARRRPVHERGLRRSEAAGPRRRAQAWGAGINWYLGRSFCFMRDYDRTRFTGGASSNGGEADRAAEQVFIARAQVVF